MDSHLSQAPCLARENESLNIALEKFSFAVTPIGTASHQWVHDTRKDKLILAFRQTQQSQNNIRIEGQLVMSVTVGTEILERQDLRKLAAMVDNFEGQQRQASVDRGLEPLVHVVVKFPCVALRYPTSHILRRRIQMRFTNESDYQRVIDIFERLKFPINNAAGRDVPVVPIGHLRPESTNLIQKASQSYHRDLTFASGIASSYSDGVSSIVGGTPYALHNPPLIEESPFFQRSHTGSSESKRPISSLSLNNSNTWDTISSVSFGEPLVRSNSALSNFGNCSSFLGSQMERQTIPSVLSKSPLSKDQLAYPTLLQFNDRNASFPRCRTASEAFGPALQKAQASSPNRTWSGSAFELGQNGRTASINGTPSADECDTNRQTGTRMSLVPDFLRPVSAPAQSNPDNLSQWLPPRRELPFPKARLTSKPCTTSVDVASPSPPIPECHETLACEPSQFILPQSITPGFNSNVRRIAQRRTKFVSPLAEDHISNTLDEGSANDSERDLKLPQFAEREETVSPLAGKGATTIRPSTAPGLKSKVVNPITRKRPMLAEHDSAPTSKQARIMIDRATQTQTLSGRDHTAPLALKTAEGRPPVIPVDEATHPPDAFVSDIEDFISKYKHRPAPQELWHRPGYAEASVEERQTTISDFICENLDNEEFIKLCEDTGNVWRRIGLEM